MNTVYEALRSLLRSKELDVKKLEKEIEALRVVLPIVAEAGEAGLEVAPTFDAPRPATDPVKSKPPLAGPDFDSVMAQVKSTQPSPVSTPQPRATPIPDSIPSKPRTSWP